MSITLNVPQGAKILELGGGDNPNPSSTVRVDVRPGPHTHFQVNFEEFPWPISSDEFDGVFSQFCLEHISFPNVPKFLKECFRVLKPNAKIVLVTPNTEAQMDWIKRNPNGWDGKPSFESMSEIIFGSQDYKENAHRSFFTPTLLASLLQDAGFERVVTQPYNERGTDMVVEAFKPVQTEANGKQVDGLTLKPEAIASDGKLVAKGTNGWLLADTPREKLFDKHYFNGGGKVGGYAREGYWDYPQHWATFQHVMARKPESVLELGAARGYIVKRLQDAGVTANGIEISKHCCLTRVCEGIWNLDLCNVPWPCYPVHKVDPHFDLCFSIATLEHVPMEHLPAVIAEMARTCKRGLHGIDFGEKDDGFDKTHCSLMSKTAWQELFAKHAPGWPVEVVNKEELEQGGLTFEAAKGDGKVKLNLGCFTTQFHFGWTNIDQHDLGQFSQHHGYRYQRHDLRTGLPYQTGSVDLIFAHHVLEHFTYAEGLTLLRECRRVLRPTGAMRIAVPNVEFLVALYGNGRFQHDEGTAFEAGLRDKKLSDFDEMNDGCAASPTDAGKLWSLLVPGHQAAYDAETLTGLIAGAGFIPCRTDFRRVTLPPSNRQWHDGSLQILRETTEQEYGGMSLFFDAYPLLG